MHNIFQNVSSLPHLNINTPRPPVKTLSSLVAYPWRNRAALLPQGASALPRVAVWFVFVVRRQNEPSRTETRRDNSRMSFGSRKRKWTKWKRRCDPIYMRGCVRKLQNRLKTIVREDSQQINITAFWRIKHTLESSTPEHWEMRCENKKLWLMIISNLRLLHASDEIRSRGNV